eukprot:gene13719-19614_t
MFGSNSPRLNVLLQARSSDMWDHLSRFSIYRTFQTYKSKSSNMDRHFVTEVTLRRVQHRDEAIIILVQVEVSDLHQGLAQAKGACTTSNPRA